MRLDFQIFQTLDGLTNGFPVSQHAAQPAVVHEELVTAVSSVFYRFACCALGTNEQDLAFTGRDLAQFSQSGVEHWYGLLGLMM